MPKSIKLSTDGKHVQKLAICGTIALNPFYSAQRERDPFNAVTTRLES
jgi:hypothetical protein